jgi:hypothetical protein
MSHDVEHWRPESGGMARKQVKTTMMDSAPLGSVGGVALVAVVIHVMVVRYFGEGAPGAFGTGQILGTHLAAFLVTALVATLTRLGSLGAIIAVYLLSFGLLQLLLAFTDLQ